MVLSAFLGFESEMPVMLQSILLTSDVVPETFPVCKCGSKYALIGCKAHCASLKADVESIVTTLIDIMTDFRRKKLIP